MKISARIIVSDAEHMLERTYEAQIDVPLATNLEQAETSCRQLLQALAERAQQDVDNEREHDMP